MKLENAKAKIKCDIYGCKNLADHTLRVGKKFFSSMHFCKPCLSELYATIGKELVPKPAQTPFKNKKAK